MLKLFYYCLNMDEIAKQFVVKSLSELTDLLSQPPVQVEFRPDPLPEKFRKDKLISEPCSDILCFSLWCKRIFFELLNHYPLLVYCRKDSKVAEAAIKENERAIWGLCKDDYSVSAVYQPENKYILWHETLHLFGVDDCYDLQKPNAGTTCGLDNCLMQYAPQKDTVGEWPFLCQKNIKRIQNWSNKHIGDVKG